MYPVGKISRLEPISTMHGPGIRYVVYIDLAGELEISSIDLVTKIMKYKNYFIDGGVTLNFKTLDQKDFIISCLKFFKNFGINVYIESDIFDSDINSLI